METHIAGLLCLWLTSIASAQEAGPVIFPRVRFEPAQREEAERPEPLETDRDSFTPATKTVDRGRSILESSYSFIDNKNDFESHSFPELLLRYGISKRTELRLGWNYEVGGSGSSVSGPQGLEGLEGAGVERETRVLYGFKTMVTEQELWIPQSAFVAQGQTPTSGKETDSQVVLGYVFGWKLPNQWKVDAALRYGTGTAEH